MTSQTAGYVQAKGAWMCRLRTGPIAPERVGEILRTFARATGWPVNALVEAEELTLYRHPSRTHGTPLVADCAAAARFLAAANSWEVDLGGPSSDVLIPVGLVEGYDHDATIHPPEAVTEALPDAECTLVWLVSARLVDGQVRWHEKPAVVVRCSLDLTGQVEAVARKLHQEQIVVTSFRESVAGLTYSLHLEVAR